MKKLLITGASGFLGWNLCRAARKRWNVTGTFFSHDVALPGANLRKCDLTDLPAVTRLFGETKPDAVVHAAASPSPEFCQNNPLDSRRINVDASEHIARLCAKLYIPCAFTSTDLVFDGNCPPYSEKTTPRPINTYGEQKVEAEKKMTAAHNAMLIFRMPLMFGDAPATAKSFIQPMIRKMQRGEEVLLFVDEFRTPISGGDAAKGILDLLLGNAGIFHLGGKERISRYDFGVRLAKCLGLKKNAIRPVFQKDLVFAAPRPADVSLDSRKAFSLGFNPDEPETALLKLECMKPVL